MSDALLVALCALVSAVVSIILSRFKDAEIEKLKGELARHQVIFQAQYVSERDAYRRIWVAAREFLDATAGELSARRYKAPDAEQKHNAAARAGKALVDAFDDESPFLSPDVHERARAYFEVVTGARVDALPPDWRVENALTGAPLLYPKAGPEEVEPARASLSEAIRVRLAAFGPKDTPAPTPRGLVARIRGLFT